MNPTLVSLLAVTIGFTLLVLWVYWPARKQQMERHGSIPLADEHDADAHDADAQRRERSQ
jgi:cbb3-type cytochrome oxidase subunit 3